MNTDTPKSPYKINEKTYARYVRALQILESRIGLNLKIHNADELLNKGQIFLFNHFARFETIIPPYLIFKHTGAYCRSIADHTLYEHSVTFSKFLTGGGAVPDNLPGLLPFLASEILRGRKVVIFPEGGMVKDRRVTDDAGRLGVFSTSTLEYRKHHRGAAVLALILDIFKHRIRSLFRNDDLKRIEHWRQALGLESAEALLVQANEPTLIVPSTITFHPIQIDDNILNKVIEFFTRGMPTTLVDELTVEGNLLFRETDMDIRLGDPIRPRNLTWLWMYKVLTNRYFLEVDSLDDLFGLKPQSETWSKRILGQLISKDCESIRDAYMRGLYSGITVNFSHLAASLIAIWCKRGRMEVPAYEFHKVIYLAIKQLQKLPNIYLHRGLTIVQNYNKLLAGECDELNNFLRTCEQAHLVAVKKSAYRFLERPTEGRRKTDIRRDNPIEVHANEIAPIPEVKAAIEDAINRAQTPNNLELAQYLFDDEMRDFSWNRQEFSKKIFQEINKKETAITSGAPYFLLPQRKSNVGILLVHGFLSSPAELAGFGEEMHSKGYAVLGVRLAGHGTSPFDLQERRWQEWLDSVRRGYQILATITEHIVVVGFSAGGALALLLAAEHPDKLTGVAVVSMPLAVKDRNSTFVPMVNFLSKLSSHIPGIDGIRPFYYNTSAHPETNYRSMPMNALQEFSSLLKAVKNVLSEVTTPTLILESENDPIVTKDSAEKIFKLLSSTDKDLQSIQSDRHSLIYENIGETWTLLEQFIHKAVEKGLIFIGDYLNRSQECEKLYPSGLQWNLTSVDEPVHTIFEKSAAHFAEQPCLSFLGRIYRYREVQELINQTTAGLQHLGIHKGDRVGLCLPNSPYFVVAYYAALKAGATVVNFNPLYTEEEIAAQIDDSGVSIMFTLDLDPLYPKVAAAQEHTALSKIVVCSFTMALPPLKKMMFSSFKRSLIANIPDAPHIIFFEKLTSYGSSPAPVDINSATDIALLQYTGGTTGVPKGAMLTHTNVSTNTEQVRLWLGNVSPGGEKFLAVLPLFHVFAMTGIMNLGIATGSELILLPRFDLKGLLKTIVKERPTIFPAVPSIFSAINNFSSIENMDLSSIRFCISGGAPLPTQVKERFEQLTGCTVVEGYGLSETAPVVSCNPLHCSGKANSIGLPLPGTEIEIRNLEDPVKRVKIGEKGELCVRGPQVMPGYWNRPQETNEAFVNGWFKTGDVGYVDEQGYLFLTDRLKEIIISSGYNIYPRILEKALYRHPDVEEAVVIGIPDTYKGEVPKAFVKLRSGGTVTEEELLAFSAGHLNPIEHITSIEFREHLPKTLVGKLSKKELIEEEVRKSQTQPSDSQVAEEGEK